MSRCSASPSPSLVPLPLETGAQVQGFSPTALEFTAETDSALEGTGFEPSVPRKAPGVVLVSSLGRADFSVRGGSSRGDMSPLEPFVDAVPMVRIRFTPGASQASLIVETDLQRKGKLAITGVVGRVGSGRGEVGFELGEHPRPRRRGKER